MNQNLSHIYVVLDRSGSMSSIRADMEGGFDTFIRQQREAGGDCRVTLAQFDDQYEVVYADRPLGEVPPLSLVPRGSTALLDAIGLTINAAGAKLAAMPEDQRPFKVFVIIITDGHENASREYQGAAGRNTIKSMVQRQERDYAWEFVYLGANQDAVTVGEGFGIKSAKAMKFAANAAGLQEAYASLSHSVNAVRAGAAPDLSFSDEDRKRQDDAGA